MNYQAIVANHVIKSGNKERNLLSSIILFILSFVLAATFGYSASTPAVSLSTSRITFSSYGVGSTSSAQNLTVTNSGKASLKITSITVMGTYANNFSESNDCITSLAPGASCLVHVVFKPTATGERSGYMSIDDNAAGGVQNVILTGIGTASAAAEVSISAASLTFGSISVGSTSAAQNITLSNPGTAALSVTGISISGTNSGDFAKSNTCGSSLAAGSSCTISVTFKPSASGSRAASISIANSVSAQSISLSGTGTAATIVVSPSSLAFGNQAVSSSSSAQVVTVSNSGNAALSITGISISGTNPGDFAQSNNCGSSLAANASCKINVTFTPAASGSRSASISIANGVSAQSVSLTGTGTAASIAVSPSSLAFATQSVGVASSAQSITISNSGNAALSISGISISGTNASDFAQSNTCGSSVAASSSCTINVTFNPAASGSRSASISIANSVSAQSVSLSGAGSSTSGIASLSASSLAFGNEPVQMTSPTQTVTLTNSGSSALNISGLSVTGANSSDFAQNNDCPVSLAAGANCSIVVLFTPSDAGARSATVTINDNAASSSQSVAVSGNGTHDVAITWTASTTSDIVGYNVYRGTQSGAESSIPLNSAPTNAINYTDTSVSAGTEYFYIVTAVMSEGGSQSAASAETTAMIPAQ